MGLPQAEGFTRLRKRLAVCIFLLPANGAIFITRAGGRGGIALTNIKHVPWMALLRGYSSPAPWGSAGLT